MRNASALLSGHAARERPNLPTASTHEGAHVRAMQRRRLLRAFVAVVAEQGLDRTSVGAVCTCAGVSRRTFYELFEDREACFLAALEDALHRLAVELVPVYRCERPWRERVRTGLTVLLERFDADPALAQMCVVQTLRAGPAVLECRARTLAALAAAVEEGSAEALGSVPPLTAQGAVGGALAVLHTQLLAHPNGGLTELTGPLTAMIVHPYLGSATAEEELHRPASKTAGGAGDGGPKDPFNGLSIRFTYRTARVLATIAELPGASNREVRDGAGIVDEGQASRLLARLSGAGLIANDRDPTARGEPNAWSLTERGAAIHGTLAG